MLVVLPVFGLETVREIPCVVRVLPVFGLVTFLLPALAVTAPARFQVGPLFTDLGHIGLHA